MIDDRYRAKLQATIEALRYWVPTISDSASIAETDSADYWRIDVSPHIANTCPFELILRTDGYHDLIVAGEASEDQPTDDLDPFVPLAQAISNGRVIQKIAHSAATQTPLSIETIVMLPKGSTWKRFRELDAASSVGIRNETVVETRHFLPYKR